MKVYFSHFTAAKMWDIPYVDTIFSHLAKEMNSVDVTISDHDARYIKNGRNLHACELDLPSGAVVTRNGVRVASPELVFLELANELSIHRLILLGLQLCSHPPGIPSKALTTTKRLKAFLAKTEGHRGHRKALQAVKYLENGSASIMESIAYMILTLPNRLGGFGLCGAVFNYEIELTREAQRRIEQYRCFMDMFYKQTKIAVEYESFTHHSSPSEQGKGMTRSAVLKRQGIVVMQLSTIQLYNKEKCKDFANDLAEQLGKRIRITAARFEEMNSLLRGLLPSRK